MAFFEYFIAKRYFLSKRKVGFISVITYFATLGIMLGVAVLNVVLSVMNGFEEVVVEKVIGNMSHIQVSKFHNVGIDNYDELCDSLRKFDHVIGTSPLIYDRAGIQSDQSFDAVIVNGIDTATIHDVLDIKTYMYGGKFDLGPQINAADGDTLPGVVLGDVLADRLGLVVGEPVILASLRGVKLTGRIMPRLKRCLVTGVFHSGFIDFDNAFVFVNLETAQSLFKLKGKVNQIDVMLDDMDLVNEVGSEIEKTLQYPYTTMNWIERNEGLFFVLSMEKKLMFLLLNLIILVAVFNIISALIMLVLNKKKEIGILRSMGATKKNIMRIFIFEGLTAGVIGTGLGTLLGLFLCYLQHEYKIISLPSEFYTIDSLPIKVVAMDFLIVGVCAFLLSLAATIYPSYQAAKQKTVEALVYE